MISLATTAPVSESLTPVVRQNAIPVENAIPLSQLITSPAPRVLPGTVKIFTGESLPTVGAADKLNSFR